MPPALSLASVLFDHGTRRRQRQIHPNAGPYLAVRHPLARIITAAAQRRRRVRCFRHVSKRSHTDATLHIGQKAGIAAGPCRILSRGAPERSRGSACVARGRCAGRRALGGAPAAPPLASLREAPGLSEASFRVPGVGAAARRFRAIWRCRAPTRNSTRWRAPGKRQESSIASRVTTSSANWPRRIQIVACVPSFRAAALHPNPRPRAIPKNRRPPDHHLRRAVLQTVQALTTASRKAENPKCSYCTSILKSSSKMAPATKLRDGAHLAGIRHRRHRHAAGLDLAGAPPRTATH